RSSSTTSPASIRGTRARSKSAAAPRRSTNRRRSFASTPIGSSPGASKIDRPGTQRTFASKGGTIMSENPALPQPAPELRRLDRFLGRLSMEGNVVGSDEKNINGETTFAIGELDPLTADFRGGSQQPDNRSGVHHQVAHTGDREFDRRL